MKKRKFKLSKILLFFILVFMLVSVITIYSASTYLPKYLGNLALKQFIYYIFSFVIIFFIIKIKNNNIFKIVNFFYILGVLSLFLLLIFGNEINGSKCWFVIPYIGSIQPSEFVKYILVIKLSMDCYLFFCKDSDSKKELFFILKEIIIILIPCVLTFLEPDTGAVFMYLIASLIIFFVAPFRKRWKFCLIIFGVCFVGLFCYFYFFNRDLFIDILGDKIFYRIERLINWKNGEGMQLENSLISIGTSNILGHGYNRTPLYFPESGTDFIYSVFASNFGLLGGISLIIVILLFDLYLIYISIRCTSILNKLIIVGTLSCLLYQQVQNIGMTLGLLPITGITLPFISYGGSSLISNMIMLGFIFNIYNENRNHLSVNSQEILQKK
mgnify:CR=1 FL=1